MNVKSINDFIWNYLHEAFPFLKKTYDEEGCLNVGVGEIDLLSIVCYVGNNDAYIVRYSADDIDLQRVNPVTELTEEKLLLHKIASYLRGNTLKPWILHEESKKKIEELEKAVKTYEAKVDKLRREYDWISVEDRFEFLDRVYDHLVCTPENDEVEEVRKKFEATKKKFTEIPS